MEKETSLIGLDYLQGMAELWKAPERPNSSLSDQPLDERLRAFEDELFKRAFEDEPSEDPTIYQMSIFKDKEASDDNRQVNRERAREHTRAARNFVWLLYGLAPSLPAVIHTHIMGLEGEKVIYDAELSLHSIDMLSIATIVYGRIYK